MLPTFVGGVIPKQQKDADNNALKALYNAVLKEQKVNPELDLNKIAEQFPSAATSAILRWPTRTTLWSRRRSPPPISAMMSGRRFSSPISAPTPKTAKSALRWLTSTETVNVI